MASSSETVISSWDKSSPIILEPPDTLKTIGVSDFGSTEVLWTPLVSIKESQYFSKGAITFFGFSNFSVGPRKYPWSTANINARLLLGLIILDNLFCNPHSISLRFWNKKNTFLKPFLFCNNNFHSFITSFSMIKCFLCIRYRICMSYQLFYINFRGFN